MYDTYFNVFHDVIIHILSHLVDSMVGIVVHDSIREHEHHIPLELLCATKCPTLHRPFDGLKVHRPTTDHFKISVKLSFAINF